MGIEDILKHPWVNEGLEPLPEAITSPRKSIEGTLVSKTDVTEAYNLMNIWITMTYSVLAIHRWHKKMTAESQKPTNYATQNRYYQQESNGFSPVQI